jgi:hypothetical protein
MLKLILNFNQTNYLLHKRLILTQKNFFSSTYSDHKGPPSNPYLECSLEIPDFPAGYNHCAKTIILKWYIQLVFNKWHISLHKYKICMCTTNKCAAQALEVELSNDCTGPIIAGLV